ncbi:MAG: response regulator [Myxococcota bacterium]|nr:response regulator [Myxococcota bacterium]
MAGKLSTDECLKILGLTRDATPEDYRRAYKDLAEVWHPDRLAHNERLQLMATEQIKQINEAYAYLLERWKSGRLSSPQTVARARPCVLCVDDEALVLKGLKRQLSFRYDVMTAPSGQAGLDTLFGDDDIAVILSDLIMPEMDGIAFLRQAMLVSPHTTRILLTGYKESIPMAVALDRQFLFEILDKACGEELLFQTIQKGVDAWQARRERAATGHLQQP